MDAIQDCLKSIEIDPNYSKAYSRLGLAYYAQGNYRDAIDKGFRKGWYDILFPSPFQTKLSAILYLFCSHNNSGFTLIKKCFLNVQEAIGFMKFIVIPATNITLAEILMLCLLLIKT